MNELNEDTQELKDSPIAFEKEAIPEVQSQVTPLQFSYNAYCEQKTALKNVNRDIRNLKIEINNATKPSNDISR